MHLSHSPRLSQPPLSSFILLLAIALSSSLDGAFFASPPVSNAHRRESVQSTAENDRRRWERGEQHCAGLWGGLERGNETQREGWREGGGVGPTPCVTDIKDGKWETVTGRDGDSFLQWKLGLKSRRRRKRQRNTTEQFFHMSLLSFQIWSCSEIWSILAQKRCFFCVDETARESESPSDNNSHSSGFQTDCSHHARQDWVATATNVHNSTEIWFSANQLLKCINTTTAQPKRCSWYVA